MDKEELNRFCDFYGLTREDVGKILGCSINTVNSWFYGSRNMPKIKVKILKESVDGGKKESKEDSYSPNIKLEIAIEVEKKLAPYLKDIEGVLSQLVLDNHRMKMEISKLTKSE
jgi:transcriptional regulator with XRE-family HTH domain